MNLVTPDKYCPLPKTAPLFFEKLMNDFVARKTEMSSHVSHDSGKRTYLQRIVQRHREMVGTAALSRDPQVAPSLPGWFIAEMTQRLGEIGSGNIAWKGACRGSGVNSGSCRHYFFTNEMQANDRGSFALIEMAAHRLPDVCPQRFEMIRLGKN
jgi:hypothetical protein